MLGPIIEWAGLGPNALGLMGLSNQIFMKCLTIVYKRYTIEVIKYIF